MKNVWQNWMQRRRRADRGGEYFGNRRRDENVIGFISSGTSVPKSPPSSMAILRLYAPGSLYGPCPDGCEHPSCVNIYETSKRLCEICSCEIAFNADYHVLTNGLYMHCRCMNTEHTHKEIQDENSSKGIFVG